MATLHMDIGEARDLSDKMKISVDSLQTILKSLNYDVTNFGVGWIGNSPTEFQADISLLLNGTKQMTESLESLESLRIRLENYIVQWEFIDSELGS